ncbi:AMP-binding protein [Agreia pratensis]|uniref:Long-chain-fatty-acid--CoA ligase n=1 Tax=Agreia pratensis TaxID=150121 RepID=A0A1X7KGF9_9MICO|nr:AMP-binding protein [Agreia pratensis]SMG40064.1 long-chain acyl-CoA synthetase [Agreia pratensis]
MLRAENPPQSARPWLASYPPGQDSDIPEITFRSIPELVAATCAKFGDQPAFSNMGHALSFREVDVLSDRMAAFYQKELGLVPGDRIVIQLPNLLQFPVAMFGALKAGLVVVNANPLYTAHELKSILVDSGAVAVVVLENFAVTLDQEIGGTDIRHVILTSVGDLLPLPQRAFTNFAVRYVKKMVPAHSLSGTISFRDALSRGAQLVFDAPNIAPEDLAFLQYTGGTTGGTKAAMLTHHNMLANQFQIMGPIRVALQEGKETVIAALPLYHVFCLTVNCLGFFHFGAHNVLITNPRETDALIKTVTKYRPSVLILVSTLAAALLDRPGFDALDFTPLKLSVAGGMALRTQVAEEWERRTGSQMVEGYGLTEASPVVSVNPTVGTARLGTIGLPLPSTYVEIRDDDDVAVPLGERGELVIYGPQVMKGYWNKPEESAKAIGPDGWLHTGDVAIMDADGYVTIVDRMKDMIVVGGFNVYPAEVEEAVLSDPRVKEAGVIGVEDEHSGETVKLFVVRQDPSLTEADIRGYLKDRLAGYKRPKYIVFRDELPKTNVGKILRRELREPGDAASR